MSRPLVTGERRHAAKVEVPEANVGRNGRVALPVAVIAAVFALCLAVILRLTIVVSGALGMDSDEGTMGLMGLHIAYHGRFPAVFYGQSYMGSCEAYLAAAAFRVFGPSDLTLRLGLVLLATLFLGVIYAMARALYGDVTALAAVIAVSCGSRELLARQLKAVGGYPEVLAAGAFLYWLAFRLGASTTPSTRVQPARLAAFGLWGFVAGLALWSDPLVLIYVATAGASMLVVCRREPRVEIGFAVGMGLLIGLGPLIAYNLTAAAGQDTLHSVLHLAEAGGSAHTTGSGAWPRRLAGLLAVSIPVMTGGNGVCTLSAREAWPLSSASSAHTVLCTSVHATWGLGVLLLWIAAVAAATSHAWAALRTRHDAAAGAARSLTHVALLAGFGLTLLAFLASPAPARAPWYNVRYLTGLWIGIPAVLASPARRLEAGWRTARGRTWVLAGTVLAAFLVSGALDTAQIAQGATSVHRADRRERMLIARLDTLGVHHIYSDYWTCDWLAFETRERIICAALDGRLRPSLDRYLPYRREVAHDPRAAYVFAADSPQAARIGHRVSWLHAEYRISQFSGYMIALPRGAGRAQLGDPVAL